MTLLTPDVQALLTAGHLVHLVTLNADGSPQVTVVWCGIEDGEIVSAHLGRHQKVRNIERNPQVALSIETDVVGENGLMQYLVINGRARITEGGAPELLRRLAKVYLGPDVEMPLPPDPPAGFITRITPEKITGNGPWAT
jgi:PPOX class probable F420-dependent enzyme